MESEDRSVTGIILQTSPLTVTPLGREKSVTVSGEICTTNLSRRNPLSRARASHVHFNQPRTVGYFAVPYQINTFYPMFYGNIYLFGTWGLSINIWMTNFDEGALWLLV